LIQPGIENANVFWRSGTSHIKLIIVIGTYVRKGRILLAIDKVDRRRDPHFLEAHLLRRVIHSNQPIRVGIGRRLEQHTVHDAENHGVCTDCYRESDQGDCRE
jgi:hypothetical protein